MLLAVALRVPFSGRSLPAVVGEKLHVDKILGCYLKEKQALALQLLGA